MEARTTTGVSDRFREAIADRYRIDREIGAGGMATVYLARDLKHDRDVAVKVLKPELGAVLGVERFLAEIKVTANLQHPNLLPLFDSGEAEGLLFYVMPFVDGESLRARLDREKQLPVDEAVRIAVALANALEYAHGHGIVHRDLKPENILLQSGQPVIADFGIALAVSKAGGERVTQTGLSLGTPHYMSPEQATGDRIIDGRSDIYSLGAMTYEMLTGEPPHTGSSMQAIIARVITEQPRPLRLVRPSVPEHVDAAVEHALEKLPADRWATAHEFAEALQGRFVPLRTRAGSTAAAARGLSSNPGWRARARDPVVLVLAVVTLAALALAVRARRPSAPASGDVVRFTIPRSQGTISPSATLATMAISPDGRLLAFIGSGADGRQQLVLRALDDIAPRALPGTEGATNPIFSPDGKWIAFARSNQLFKVTSDGGPPQHLGDLGGAFNGASWSPSGVVITSANTGLFLTPETGGPARPFIKADAAKNEVLQVVPLALEDGKTVLYSSWPNATATAARIAIASLETGKTTILNLPGIHPIRVLDGTLIYATASGAIMGVAIDVARQRVTGTPVLLVSDVAVKLASGYARAALSGDGTLFYQTGALTSQAVLADFRGTTKPLLAESREYAYPRYSPDGSSAAITIATTTRSDVWLYDVATGTPARLTTEGNVNERPEWTPDGTRVLYRSDRGKRSEIWWRPADLSGPPERLLANDRADYFEAVVSPDGRFIAYQVDTGDANLYYRALSGDTAARAISATRFVETMPRISPDGRWIAFVTDESGTGQVVVQPFPGPGGRTQVSVNGGEEPVWSHDGRRLFYRGDSHFIAATVRTSPAFSVAARETLFTDVFGGGINPHANYDVAPDGAHLLLLKTAGEGELIVVTNWRAVVRARMAGSAAK